MASGTGRRETYTTTAQLVVLAIALSARSARAQEPIEPTDYRPSIERALYEYQLGNYEEARDQFTRAHTLFPNARTLRGLGFTAFELRNYVDAVRALEEALATKVRPLTGKLREETEEMLSRARGYVGSLVLKVDPPTAVLSIDGIRMPDGSTTLHLDVGDHLLEFRAEGRLTERRAVRIKGDQSELLQIALARTSTESTPVPRERPVAQTPVYRRWWLWTTVGLVVAGAAAGVAIALTKNTQREYRGAATTNTPADAEIAALRFR